MNLSAWVLVGAASGCALRCVFRRICRRGGAARRGLCGAPANGNISIPRQFAAARDSAVCVPATALKLLRSGWLAFVVAWGGTLSALWLVAQAIPAARPPIEGPRGPGRSSFAAGLPAGPGESLLPTSPEATCRRSWCSVSFYGIAIQRIENKQGVLRALEVVKNASVTIWGWVVRIAPVGVFALFAGLAGTIRIELLGNLLLSRFSSAAH